LWNAFGPLLGEILYGGVGGKITLFIAAGFFVLSTVFPANIKQYRKSANEKAGIA